MISTTFRGGVEISDSPDASMLLMTPLGTFELGRLSHGWCALRDPDLSLPPCEGTIVVRLDKGEHFRNVSLPDGIKPGQRSRCFDLPDA